MVSMSLVVPTYNRSRLLERCLQSVQLQSLSDLELLVLRQDLGRARVRELVEQVVGVEAGASRCLGPADEQVERFQV